MCSLSTSISIQVGMEIAPPVKDLHLRKFIIALSIDVFNNTLIYKNLLVLYLKKKSQCSKHIEIPEIDFCEIYSSSISGRRNNVDFSS